MNKGSQAKASRVELDGAFRKIPGFENGDQALEQLPFTESTAIIDLSTGATNKELVIPFDYTIVSVGLTKTVAPDVATSLNIGTSADPDKFLDAFQVDTVAGATREELIDDALMLVTDGDAGDILRISNIGEDTASGAAYVDLIYVPR